MYNLQLHYFLTQLINKLEVSSRFVLPKGLHFVSEKTANDLY